MELRNIIHKATLLADLRGDNEKAIELLRESLAKKFNKNEIADMIVAKVFLGELLIEKKEFDEAIIHLQDSIKIFEDSDIERDLVGFELNIAEKLITQIS